MRDERNLQRFAIELLTHPSDLSRLEALLACLQRFDSAHAKRIAENVACRGGVSESVAIIVVLELLRQRVAISFAPECFDRVVSSSRFDHHQSKYLVAEIRDWIAGGATKQRILKIGNEVAEVARKWEKDWYAWYYNSANDKSPQQVDASQEPLFVFDAAINIAAAVQPSERSRGNRAGHFRKWCDSVDEAIWRLSDGVACRKGRGSAVQTKTISADNQWRLDRLKSVVDSGKTNLSELFFIE